MEFVWIANDQQLQTACTQARLQDVVALDTEFIRTRSFYPQLGLIQLFDGKQVSLIDPKAINDFSPFVDLLSDPKVLKILHACSEDLEVFWHQFQQMPEPMVDTQVIAAFLKLGSSVGFAKLVEQYVGITLDKGASRTDWLARPLTPLQCHYAAADVYYLLPLYHKLAAQLAQTPWQQAVNEDSAMLAAKRKQSIEAEKAYREIGNAWRLAPDELAILQLLAKWRIEEAQKRDLALNFVVKEQSLIEIARLKPKHTSQLLDFMHPNEVRIHGKKLLWLVEQGIKLPEDKYPPQIWRATDDPQYKRVIKQWQETLKTMTPDNLSGELIAGKRQLTQLFRWCQKGQPPEKLPELLRGWRRVFGERLVNEYNWG